MERGHGRGYCFVLKYYVMAGVKNVLCTDISKDGTLSGPAVSLYKTILSSFQQ